MKLFNKTFFYALSVAFFVLLIFYHPVIIKAHEITKDPWLLINNENILIENNFPEPSSLNWTEHALSKDFNPDETINFQLQSDVLKNELGLVAEKGMWTVSLDKDFNINSTQDLKKGINELSVEYALTSDHISFSVNKTGVYTINVKVPTPDDIVIVDEDIKLIVGDEVPAPAINVNGTIYDKQDDKVLKINRDDKITFEADNADTNKYSYSWDLGENDVIKDIKASKSFPNTKLPVFVVLRKYDLSTGVYSENYVKIDSDQPSKTKVNTPPIIADPAIINQQNNQNNLNSTIALVGLSLLTMGAVVLLILALKKKKSAKIS